MASPIQIKFKGTFDHKKNKEIFNELESILGAEELYGGSILKIKNIVLYQYPTIYSDGVSVKYRFVFDALVDGDFGDNVSNKRTNQTWIRFDTYKMGAAFESEYIVTAYYDEDGEPESEVRDAYHTGDEYNTINVIVELLYANGYEMVDNVDDILVDNVENI